jgi:hypothetical protein
MKFILILPGCGRGKFVPLKVKASCGASGPGKFKGSAESGRLLVFNSGLLFAVAFGFMVENEYQGVHRIWSRTRLVTKQVDVYTPPRISYR